MGLGDQVTHFPADFPTIDRKLVAIELADFADAIRGRHRPEVDGPTGRRSMALVLAVGESAMAGGAVSVDAVETGMINTPTVTGSMGASRRTSLRMRRRDEIN